MSEISPQEFGRLQAQVEALTVAVDKLTTKVDTMNDQLSEAKGGWRTLMLLGGAGATFGTVVTWAITHFRWGGA